MTLPLIAWSNRHSPDVHILQGALGVFPYERVSDPLIGYRQISGLTIRAIGSDEEPLFHSSTGIYGFLELEPGGHRLHISDAKHRYLAWPRTVTAGPRAIEYVQLIPSIGLKTYPGETVVWGVISDGTRGIPYARITIGAGPDRVITHSDLGGNYVARFPEVRATFTVSAAAVPPPSPLLPPGPPVDSVDELEQKPIRPIFVRRLLNEALGDPAAGRDALFDLPDDMSDLAAYRPADSTLDLADRDGTAVAAVPNEITLFIGRRVRWDIVLT